MFFKVKEINPFYYLIDAGAFSYSNEMHIKPPLVAYLQRKSLFNFDKSVLDYVKIAIDWPALEMQKFL